uniref:Ribonucleoprotein, PTB binding 1 n=2 Tax=Callorhinchus milii TaxID=7868 RepID=A0A4W3K5S4_CALMI
MKKDFAARAKSELLGKQLGTRALYVHWTDVNQLTMDLLHSKCLCVDKLPHDYKDLEQLTLAFSQVQKPVFCQLAQGPDGQFRGFAVLEYETAEQAEEVQRSVDGLHLDGNHIRVLFCAPGPPGRSMLPALIAAQATAMNRGKGLLPEPNPVQILNGLSNPATLRLLLNPLLPGAGSRHQGGDTRGGSPSSRMLGAGPAMPLLGNPALSAALLRLVLQGQNQAQAQAQAQAQQKPGLLGESPLAALQHSSLGLTTPPLPGKGLLGESPAGLGAEMPLRQSQYVGDMLEPASGSRGAHSRQVTPPPVTAAALQGIPTSILGSVLNDLKRMRNRSQASGESATATSGMSLLGEPPKDLRMPQNPYLNLHSVLPLPAGGSSSQGYNQSPGLLGDYPGAGQEYQDQAYAYDYEQYGYGQGYEEYDQEYQYEQYDQYDQYDQYEQYDQYSQYEQYEQYQQYDEEAGEPLYQSAHDQSAAAYSAYSRAGTERSEAVASGYEEASPAVYTGSPTSYFTGSSRAGLRQGQSSKANSGAGLLGAAPAGCMLKTPLIGHKRGASHLIPSPEPSPEEGYIGQHSQGLGGHYADSYLKRKRIF